MRKSLITAVATAAGLAAAALLSAAASPAGFVERFKAATAAYQEKDYTRMEAELREALKLRPAHPTATYNLAAALALRGQNEAAITTLQELAEMKLVFDPSADDDFAALRGTGDFRNVRRAFERNKDTVGRPERMFRLKSPTFIAEGLAYYADTRHFYVGSVHERRIQRILRDDTEVDFVKPNDALWAVLGMFADSRRDLLWVATAAIPEMRDARPDEIGKSAILAYDLETRAQKHRFVLEGEGPHMLGDVHVVRDGTVYTTDSRGGILYSLDPDKGTFKALTQPGQLASPQGLVASEDGRHLYVADYTQGLYRYTIKDGKLDRLEVERGISVYGIDGLYRHGDDLIAIQNGIRPHRVVRLLLGDRGRKVRRMRVLASNQPAFDEPTLGVVVKHEFYFVANSQWNKFDKDGKLPPPQQLRRPLILRLLLGSPDGPAPPGAEPAQAQPPGGQLPVPCIPPLC